MQQPRCVASLDSGAQPLSMGTQLAGDVAIGRSAGLEDEAPLLRLQFEDDGVNQTPAVIGDDARTWHPLPQQLALLRRQSVQCVVHCVSLRDRGDQPECEPVRAWPLEQTNRDNAHECCLPLSVVGCAG